MRTQPVSHGVIGMTAALFLGSAAATVAWCNGLSAMRDVPMCSTRTTAPLRDAATFLVMWLTMMVAMMAPSLIPMLRRYRQALRTTTATRADALTALVGSGYFCVWTAIGALVFIATSMFAPIASHSSPVLTGLVVLGAGLLQFSPWKAHHLARFRAERACCPPPDRAHAAWRHGVRAGIHCVHCCFGLTAVLLAVGMMDLRAMVFVTIAISVERLAPGGLRAARLVGIVLVSAGAFVLAHAASSSVF